MTTDCNHQNILSWITVQYNIFGVLLYKVLLSNFFQTIEWLSKSIISPALLSPVNTCDFDLVIKTASETRK